MLKKIEDYFEKIGYLNEFRQWLNSQEGELINIKGEVFLVNSSQKELINKYYKRVIFSGSRLGRISNDFYPSLYLLEEVSRFTSCLTLNNKKSWLFVCGRDLFVSNSDRLYYFVCRNNQFIGLAKLEKKGRKTYLKNVYDIGLYLRKQNKL